MTEDFYCEEVFSGKTQVNKTVHIVAVPKRHIALITMEESDNELLFELLGVIKKVAGKITEENGACRVITNLGNYQDSNIFIGISCQENLLNK